MSVYAQNKLSSFGPNDAWTKLFGLIPADSNVLDVGCSSGNLGQALKKEKHVKVVGVDIDKADLAIAKKHLDETRLLNVETDDLSSLGMFDVVIMADVIEHLIDPVAALQKIRKLIKPKGRLVFSIPNMANITTRVELLKGRFEYKDFGLLDRTHLHFYDEQEVNRVLVEAGFSVIKTDATVRDIPEDILKRDLASVGINLTPKLRQNLKETKGLIYQFIGYAQPSANPKPFSTQTSSDLDSVSKQMREMDEELRASQARLASVNEQMEEVQKHAAAVNDQLQGILHSKGWRVLEKLHHIKHVATQRNKRTKHP